MIVRRYYTQTGQPTTRLRYNLARAWRSVPAAATLISLVALVATCPLFSPLATWEGGVYVLPAAAVAAVALALSLLWWITGLTATRRY